MDNNVLKSFLVMAQVVHDVQHEFWRPPAVLDPAIETALPPKTAQNKTAQNMVETCGGCGSEFLIGARFCHTCGLGRRVLSAVSTESNSNSNKDALLMTGLLARNVARVGAVAESTARAWHTLRFPAWLHYLHFHEIKRWVGLPTAALVAFMVGLGCVVGALAVSFFYKASNLAEFEAIQMWRIEWLLAATASFVAGILLKRPSSDRD
jgi:hypothetical protein